VKWNFEHAEDHSGHARRLSDGCVGIHNNDDLADNDAFCITPHITLLI
jgi:hypothetical protein